MVFEHILTGHEADFLLGLFFSLIAGVLIGAERELRGKSAGISTHALVIGGSMLFSYISQLFDPNEPARIAAQIVTGVGFLGAGMIIRDKGSKVTNLTTAASIWFSAAIGMAIGFQHYLVAGIALIFALVVPRIPSIEKH